MHFWGWGFSSETDTLYYCSLMFEKWLDSKDYLKLVKVPPPPKNRRHNESRISKQLKGIFLGRVCSKINKSLKNVHLCFCWLCKTLTSLRQTWITSWQAAWLLLLDLLILCLQLHVCLAWKTTNPIRSVQKKKKKRYSLNEQHMPKLSHFLDRSTNPFHIDQSINQLWRVQFILASCLPSPLFPHYLNTFLHFHLLPHSLSLSFLLLPLHDLSISFWQ